MQIPSCTIIIVKIREKKMGDVSRALPIRFHFSDSHRSLSFHFKYGHVRIEAPK